MQTTCSTNSSNNKYVTHTIYRCRQCNSFLVCRYPNVFPPNADILQLSLHRNCVPFQCEPNQGNDSLAITISECEMKERKKTIDLKWLFAEMCTKRNNTKQNTNIALNERLSASVWFWKGKKTIFSIKSQTHYMQCKQSVYTQSNTHILFIVSYVWQSMAEPCSMPSCQSHSRCKFHRFTLRFPLHLLFACFFRHSAIYEIR